jgi:uncharacterized protein with von Willebrand factor type A (vWA) domain
MSEFSDESKAEVKRNRRTLERLQQVAQEPEAFPDRRRYLRELARRLEYIDQKISQHDCSKAAEAHHRAERKAIAWAIRELAALYPHLIQEPGTP